MESLLKKFEKDRVNVSKIYSGGEVGTGRMSYSENGITYRGTEYAYFDNECVYTYLVDDFGQRHDGQIHC